MAEGVISLINDTDGRRLVSSFLSTQQGTAPPFVYGDKTPITVRLVTATTSGDSPWKEISLTGKTVRVGIGTPGKRPTSGTFTISYDGDTTSSLAYNASESAISIALNALPSITSAGGVVVTSSAPGLIKIIFNDDGERETFTINSNSLFPTSSGYAAQSIVGDVSTKEIVNIRLETDHVAYVELTDPLDSAAITVATVREGAADVSDIQTLIFDPLPYGGTYTLTIDGEETASLDYNASAASVKSALESLSLFQTGDVTVSGTFPEFTIAFDPSLGDVGEITGDASALVVPTGRKGTLSTATIGVSELLNGSYRADATLEIEVYTTATASSWTTLQAACVVKDDVIPNEPASPTDVPSCLTAESLTSGNIETALGYTPADAATNTGTNTGDQDLSGLAVKANNLSDLTNASTARTNLGLGTLATQSGTFSDKADQSALAAETAARVAADALKADKSNVLELDNTTPFTPTADNHPATKAYVDENAGGGGGSGSETKIPMTIVTRSGSTTPHAVNVVGALNANVSGITNSNTVTGIFFGSNVTSIGDSALSGFDDLVGEVNIPGHITSIGSEAFWEAGQAGTTLRLNEGLVSIGYAAFSYSFFSGELRIPSTVSYINSSAFEGMSNLTSLVLPDTIIQIDYYAFASCSGFTGDLIIPGDGCVILGDAFYDCSGFDDIYVRTPVGNIDDYAFFFAASGGTLYVHPDYFAGYGATFGSEGHPVAEWTSFPDPMP